MQWDRNVSFAVPVGPFLCFAMLISATFLSSEFGLYTSSRYINITTSASCSIDPDSLKSDRNGLLSFRCSRLLFSCERAIIGMSSSFARLLSCRVIDAISFTRFSLFSAVSSAVSSPILSYQCLSLFSFS